MHVVSEKDLNSAEESDDGQRRGANQRRSDGNLFVKVMLLEEIPAALSLVKLCEDQWVYTSLDQRSKTTSHQKLQKN